ncbi:MAG TPA: ATP-binding protein [Stellaceae bacterium]|nr:ATP-binding protein [Stellaceae bacterium]
MPLTSQQQPERARRREHSEFGVGDGAKFGVYFPLLFERHPIPLYIYDWDTLDILLVNDATLAQYGYSRDAFLRLRVTDLLVPRETDQLADERARTVLKASERLHRKADGTIFPVDIFRHRLEVDGRMLALVACPDAGVRAHAQEQLRRSTDDLRRSHENLARAQRIAKTGSVERDFHAERTEWSDETYRIFGVTRETFTPSPAAMLVMVHPDDRTRVAEALAKTREGVSVQLQYRIIRPDGSVRVLYREAEVIFDAAGKPLRSVSMLRDVTRAHEAQERQRKLEAELRVAKDEAEALARAVQEANAALERRVEERTAELKAAQDALLKKERLATLGQLTATVAHELRNPLSAIKNTTFVMGELAAAGGVDIERPLTRIQRSIERCNRIVSDLLDYSRTRALDRRPREFDHWLRETLEDQPVPPSVTLVLDLAAGAARVPLDSERFCQVVINIVDNAVQAMAAAPNPAAPPRLVVATRALDRQVRIVFEDNGPGIAPEILGRVFEPLFSTKNFGTGLGLATVKHIVEQHEGSIAIASTPGEGTRVAIDLPLATAAQAA